MEEIFLLATLVAAVLTWKWLVHQESKYQKWVEDSLLDEEDWWYEEIKE